MPDALAIAARLGVSGRCDWRALRRNRGLTHPRQYVRRDYLKV